MTFSMMLLSKVIVATTIAGLAEAVRRRTTRPELAYALWATVLAVLLVPPAVTIPVPAWWIDAREAVLSEFTWGAVTWRVLCSVWLVGVAFVTIRQFRNLRWVGRLVEFAAPAPPLLSRRCQELARELGIRYSPHVVTAGGQFSPFLWHPFFGAARVVLPVELLDRLSSESVDAVLRHELVHLRRRDVWRRRLDFIVLAIWWCYLQLGSHETVSGS